jgi:N-sulfoglucosamine sulfohydrolase
MGRIAEASGHLTRGVSKCRCRSTLATVFSIAAALVPTHAATQGSEARPNIVWLVLDDASPALGAYGDRQAITPTMDRLARAGVRFTRAFTHTPVCAPSRFGLVTGIYPTTAGAHHMRSQVINPPLTFMHYLRRAGYFVAWPGKVDFNFDPGARTTLPERAADSTAEWLNARPPRQPFFAYLNLGVTHEAQVRADATRHARNTARLKPSEFHDPAKMEVPSFLPDAPEVRQELARFYDLMTAADYQVSDVLEWLGKSGLSANTIVFLFSDHGTGMPRSKRWVYDSGIRVPLVITWPGHITRNSVRDDLISFVDFAPTVLSMAGLPVPSGMQGQVFLGDKRARERDYIYASRDRMDEAFDRIRGVRDKRFKYLRNFHPELPYSQRIEFNEQSPAMRAWRHLHEKASLTGAPEAFFAPQKPPEELYDTVADPDEIRNIATHPRYKTVLDRMRRAMDEWIRDTRDLGEIPEEQLVKRGVLRAPGEGS